MSRFPKRFDSPFESYIALRQIGEGGAGRVLEVRGADQHRFALKCLLPERVNTERLKRFKNEVEFCQRSRHPNIVRVCDVGSININEAKCPFYVMPLYAGTLRNVLKVGLASQDALRLFRQLLDGVEAAHLQGVWHRDLKPENVLLNEQASELVVADFGIAHFEDFAAATKVGTRLQAKLANLQYAAPEQRERGAAVDSRADIFALGLMLNELFTHTVAHGRGHELIGTVAPAYRYLDDVVDAMLQQDPAKRLATVGDVKKELIARGNEFAALQRLDEQSRQVVPAYAPGTVLPVEIIAADVEERKLTLTLSRAPEAGWVQCFANPAGNYENRMGYDPFKYMFRDNVAVIGLVDPIINADLIQALVDQFKRFSAAATAQYQRQLQREAVDLEARETAKLRKGAEEAKRRAEILGKLKI